MFGLEIVRNFLKLDDTAILNEMAIFRACFVNERFRETDYVQKTSSFSFFAGYGYHTKILKRMYAQLTLSIGFTTQKDLELDAGVLEDSGWFKNNYMDWELRFAFGVEYRRKSKKKIQLKEL